MFGGPYFLEWGFLDICEALLIIMSIWDQRKMGRLDLNRSNEISAESKSLWLMEEYKEVEGRKESPGRSHAMSIIIFPSNFS